MKCWKHCPSEGGACSHFEADGSSGVDVGPDSGFDVGGVEQGSQAAG